MDFSSSDFGEIWHSIISVTVNCIVSLHFAMLIFLFLISKKRILLIKEYQEKYKEFTVVNKGKKRNKKTEVAPNLF